MWVKCVSIKFRILYGIIALEHSVYRVENNDCAVNKKCVQLDNGVSVSPTGVRA